MADSQYGLVWFNDHEKDGIPSICPGLPSEPNNAESLRASPSLDSRPALPSSPAIGLCSLTCSPLASCCTLNRFRPRLSTWLGSCVSLLK